MWMDVIGNPFANKNTRLRIDGKVVQHLYAQSLEAFPLEFSALLLGNGSTVTRSVALVPDRPAPDRFQWDARQLFACLRTCKQEGLHWLGVVHSHPTAPAVPSETDVAEWHYPALSYWVLSLAGPVPQLKAYRFSAGGFSEVEYDVIP
jgi:proteasome lid subunit RPN8/RPN11